jgi:hypothetical protein
MLAKLFVHPILKSVADAALTGQPTAAVPTCASLGMKPNLLTFLLPHLRERFWKKAQQVRSHQGILADGFTGQVPRQSMKIDRESGGFERILRMLRD